MHQKQKNVLYSKQYWYINTYNSLGSEWLVDSLIALKLDEKYVFSNLSANAGYYEKDAYEQQL